jgi:hypothetical protein
MIQNIFLVDYDDFTFFIEKDAYIIADTGKTDLNIKICNNIIENKKNNYYIL